jgi:hypothetical protein
MIFCYPDSYTYMQPLVIRGRSGERPWLDGLAISRLVELALHPARDTISAGNH